MISLCFYALDIAFLLFIYQTENTSNCITLLKAGWSLGVQEDRTALYFASSVIETLLINLNFGVGFCMIFILSRTNRSKT